MSAWAVAIPVLGAVAGGALGLAFFGGLLATSARLAGGGPIWLVALSYAARLALLAVALVALARVEPGLLLGALPGLVVARTVLTRAVLGGRLDRTVGLTPHGHRAEGG
jgi:hypothetical protein